MSEILIRPVMSSQLVFGLDWLPLISGRASSAALRIARQRKASHIVLDGEAPASFGYGLVRTQRRGMALHSAAQNMARLYPSGSVAAILSLESEGHWLVAIHEGAVMARTDIVYRSLEQAHEALHALQRAHPRLLVLHPGAGAPSLAAIAAASDAGTSLRSTGYRRRKRLLLLCFAFLLVFAVAFFRASGTSRATQAVEPAMDAAELAMRWSEAVSRAEQNITIHGVAATYAALLQVYEIPAALAGWALVRAVCQVDKQLWRCTADYDRKHRNADNKGLLSVAPPGWRLDFPTMDLARAAWTFKTDTPAFAHHRLTDEAHNRRYLLSAWQGMRPAFGKMILGPSRPVPIAPPLDAEGRPLPRPVKLIGHARRAVEFEGPLRSLSLLLPHTHAIGWRSFSLTLNESAQPSLASSRLRVTLHGDLYERYESEAPADQAAPDKDGS